MNERTRIQVRGVLTALAGALFGAVAGLYFAQGRWVLGSVWTFSTLCMVGSIWPIVGIASSRGAIEVYREIRDRQRPY